MRANPKVFAGKSRAGEIPELKVVSAPYEKPENAKLVVDTANANLVNSGRQVISYNLAAMNG